MGDFSYFVTCKGTVPSMTSMLYDVAAKVSDTLMFLGGLETMVTKDNPLCKGMDFVAIKSALKGIGASIDDAQDLMRCKTFNSIMVKIFYHGLCWDITSGMALMWCSYAVIVVFLFVLMSCYRKYRKTASKVLPDEMYDSLSDEDQIGLFYNDKAVDEFGDFNEGDESDEGDEEDQKFVETRVQSKSGLRDSVVADSTSASKRKSKNSRKSSTRQDLLEMTSKTSSKGSYSKGGKSKKRKSEKESQAKAGSRGERLNTPPEEDGKAPLKLKKLIKLPTNNKFNKFNKFNKNKSKAQDSEDEDEEQKDSHDDLQY